MHPYEAADLLHRREVRNARENALTARRQGDRVEESDWLRYTNKLMEMSDEEVRKWAESMTRRKAT